jgi:preprotein translocase subunit SecG
MSVVLILIHVIVCIALIMIVLLQTGKGADIGAAFGVGASQTLFGSTGASTFLSKATTVAAVVFMITSLSLAFVAGKGGRGGSIMKEAKAPIEQAAPVDQTNPVEPTPAQPTPAPDDSAPK